MNTDLVDAAEYLAETLTQENAALAALDLKRAGAMLAVKQRAVAEFTVAIAGTTLDQADRPLASRLRSLTDENKALLERAISAQGRVMAVFAQAVTQQPSYGGPRGRAPAERPIPFALAAQA
jgi:hypothetical protein